MNIITEPKDMIGQYVAKKQNRPAAWGSCAAFGLLNNNDELVAGIIFNGYKHPSIMMHISAERITPAFIASAMYYVFIQLNCNRITGVIEQENKNSRRFAEKLGAQLEGILRNATPHGNLCVFGLLKENAQKWVQQNYLNKLEKSWVL